MECITIKPGSEHVVQLLHDLQQLDMLEIVKGSDQEISGNADEFWGILTPEQGLDIDSHIKEMRSEWDRDI